LQETEVFELAPIVAVMAFLFNGFQHIE